MKAVKELSTLLSKLPPIIARDQVHKLLGGVISAKTLANLDSEGKGPKRMRIGRKVVYKADGFLEWLAAKTVSLN